MENLGFGLGVTAIGMGLVFGLLGLLWLVLTLLGRLDALLPAQGEAAPEGAAAAGPVVVTGRGAAELEPEALAAIALAVVEHAAMSRREASPAMRSTAPGSRIFASRWLAAGRTRQTRAFTPRR